MCNSLQQFSFHQNPRFSPLMEIPQGNTWKIAENRTLKAGPSPPPRAFKLLLLNNLRLRRKCRFQHHFFMVDDTRTAIQSFLHPVVGSSARQAHRLDIFFQIAWTDSESRFRLPDVRIEIQDRSRQHTSQLGHTPIDAWIQKMALESQRARSSPLSRQCPNRPSDEGQAASASTALDPWVEFL